MADDARIVAYAASSPPAGWYECNGASLLRASEPELFNAIGTTFGAADGTHFSLPDLRAFFAIGKAATGTASTLGTSGGSLNHTHGFVHGHTVSQPSAHADHIVTQPSAHSSLVHTGFGLDDHGSVAHSGISIPSHTVTKSSGHGTHDSAGGHDHNTHSTVTVKKFSGGLSVLNDGGKHNTEGSHTHDSHSAHDESVNGHTVSNQGNSHGSQAHTVSAQPDTHSGPSHAFTVSAHSAHSGAGVVDGSAILGTNNPPYRALIFIIAPSTKPMPAGAVTFFGGGSAPTEYTLCDGASLLRSSFPDLFAVIGTTFGAADGTHFNVPDLRSVFVIGKSAGIAFASTGGSASHTHAGSTHSHGAVQANSHSDHVVTQPTHAAMVHSGATVSAHSMTHSGFSVTNHTVTQSSGHGSHSNNSTHNHDAHSVSSGWGTDELASLYTGPSTHSSVGAHNHNSHSAHTGADLSNHAETQANTHNATHSITPANDHSVMSHNGAALTAHSAHTGGAVTDGASGASTGSEVPFLALTPIIRTKAGTHAIGGIYAVGQSSAPAGTLLCQGQAVSRTAYADLFTVYGTTFGAGDGSTTFNLPDLRGRIPRGANGDLGTSGGSRDHTHTVTATHTHATTQPSAHGAHTPTQANSHGTLVHAGMDVTAHDLAHSGLAVADHTATQADSHTAHTSDGSHTHNSHSVGATQSPGSGTTSVTSTPTTHSSDGGHTHSGAHSHSGFKVNAHSVDQPNNHSMPHTVIQPDNHTVSAHSGFAVDVHGSHSGFAVTASGTGTTDSANPPYLVVNYVAQYGEDVFRLSRAVNFSGTGALTVGTVTQQLNAVSLTPPSAPTVIILDQS